MAECHPVGFQWVMEAKARGREDHPHRPAVHPHQRGRRPARAAARRHRHRVPRRADQVRPGQRPVLQGVRRRVHERRGAGERGVPATPRTSTGCSPASTRRSGTTTRRQLAVRAGGGAAPAATTTRPRPREQEAELASTHGRQAHRPGAGRRQRGPADRRRSPSATTRCSTRARCSRSSSGTSPATRPEMVAEVCGIEPRGVPQVADWVTANSGRDRTTAWVYSVGWTQHSVGAQYIRTASILQTLLGNMGRPGGGIMALRGHASIQGSTDIPTLFNLLPGYLPMPHAMQHHSLDDYVADARGHGRLLGQHALLHGQPAQGLVGRRGDGGERLLLRLPAADRRRPQLLPHDRRHDRGQGARATSSSGRTRSSGTPTAGCSGSGWPTSTGSSSATCR